MFRLSSMTGGGASMELEKKLTYHWAAAIFEAKWESWTTVLIQLTTNTQSAWNTWLSMMLNYPTFSLLIITLAVTSFTISILALFTTNKSTRITLPASQNYTTLNLPMKNITVWNNSWGSAMVLVLSSKISPSADTPLCLTMQVAKEKD